MDGGREMKKMKEGVDGETKAYEKQVERSTAEFSRINAEVREVAKEMRKDAPELSEAVEKMLALEKVKLTTVSGCVQPERCWGAERASC